MKLIVFLFLSQLSIFAQVDSFSWNTAFTKHLRQFKMPYKNSFLASLVGRCNPPKIKDKDIKGKLVTWHLSNPYYKKSIKLRSAMSKDRRGNFKKAPVLFYISGAFSNSDDPQNRRYMRDFSRMGYHVFTFSNPWGKDMLTSQPIKPIGDIQHEAKAYSHMIKRVLAVLKKRRLLKGKNRIIGLSYGAFLAAVISAKNAVNGNPFQFKDTTLIAPPFNMAITLRRFDHLIKRNRRYLHRNPLSQIAHYRNFCKYRSDRSLSRSDFRLIEGLVMEGGFYKPFIRSVRLYDKNNNLGKIPRFGVFSSKYRQWKRRFNFRRYFTDYAPSLIPKIYSKASDLNYWKKLANKAGHSQFRILTTKNDFLNDKGQVKRSPDTLILPNGGHYGFRKHKWYRKFLKMAFKLKKSR